MKSYCSKEDKEHFLKKVKCYDSNNLAPCWSSLTQKFLRTINVNSMWLHATDQDCLKLSPENCGCVIEDDHFKSIGFVGDQTPLKIDDIAQVMDNGDGEDLESDNQYSTSDDSDNE